MERSHELDPDYSGSITVNNKKAASFTVTRKSLKDWKGVITLPQDRLAKENTITLTMNGKGVLYYSATARYSTREEPIRARGRELKLERSYTRLLYQRDRRDEWKVLRRPFDGKLNSGDEIEVTIRLKSAGRYENLVLEDYFPSGMEVIQKPQDWYSLWCGRWYWNYAHKEARDDRMVFFLNNVGKGEHTFNYLLRAETPGYFHGLPARAELMYNPEVQGYSDEMLVTIGE
jgi:uncharacterized protein YfaS (alpha-2-macroglobulin family)